MSFFEKRMNPIEINNPRVLEILKSGVEIVDNKDYDIFPLPAKNENMENWVGDSYLKYIIDLKEKHDGYPKSSKSWNFCKVHHQHIKDMEGYERIENFKTDLVAELGVRHNALFAIYPPGGYISWHNNQNAPGYNVLLTWSENGDGYWKHLDPETKEVVTIQDKAGWQCKYGYYGSYSEPNNLLYHCAATNCWRITIAFVFNSDDTGRMMAEMMVEDLQSENV